MWAELVTNGLKVGCSDAKNHDLNCNKLIPAGNQ